MRSALANFLGVTRGFSAAAWRKICVLAVLCCALILASFTYVPSSFADDKVPQDEYEQALEKSYVELFKGTEATEEQVSSFISCLSDATYNDMSAETVQALTTGNLDYEVSDKDADIFLGSVEKCLKDAGLSKIVAGPETEGGDGDGGTSSTETTGGETGGDSESPETSTKESSSYLLPLATGLTLLAIIAFAVFLLVRGKSSDTQDNEENSTEDYEE